MMFSRLCKQVRIDNYYVSANITEYRIDHLSQEDSSS